jgi:hypothetical protein
MACWKAFPNAERIQPGIQMSFFELAYEPDVTVDHMKPGDELIIVAPNGTRSAGWVLVAGNDEIVVKEKSGDAWVLTATSDAEKRKSIIYSDMLNAIWTVRHRRLF